MGVVVVAVVEVTARQPGVWPPLGIVADAESREDETARRLRDAAALIGAIGEWTRVENDPATALEAIGRLIDTYRSQSWVSVDRQAERNRVRRAESGGEP